MAISGSLAKVWEMRDLSPSGIRFAESLSMCLVLTAVLYAQVMTLPSDVSDMRPP